MHAKQYKLLSLLFILLFSACQDMHQKKKSGEAIYRCKNETYFTLENPQSRPLPVYSWDHRFAGKYPRITKEFFRCKGNPLNPIREWKREGKETLYYRDCYGKGGHGLPLREGKEFIYPCLVEILNYIQEKTGHRVVITTGHRCQEHNLYCDPTPSNWGSKHLLGAECDFFVETMETNPQEIVDLIISYYQQVPPFKGDTEYEIFKRYYREGLNVAHPPWYNKEIFIKLYQEGEGRDLDNQHSHPYIGIQLRMDRETGRPVVFNEKEAQKFRRY
ncbi:MAG: hypothetical protein KDK55_01385 [Chlamydiia bacterium]|nr:hypothetical protein [Chlamydiia bacterium]